MKHLVSFALCIMLCVAIVPAAHAEADIGFKGVGGRLSFVSPENLDGTIGFGGLVDLGTFAPNVGFGVSLDLWFASEGSIDFRDVVLGANSRYMFEIENPKVKPYAGGGLALHFLNADIPAQNLGAFGTIPASSESDTKVGLDLFGGVGYAASEKVDITGEVMYRIVSDIGQFVISAGAIFWFGAGAQ